MLNVSCLKYSKALLSKNAPEWSYLIILVTLVMLNIYIKIFQTNYWNYLIYFKWTIPKLYIFQELMVSKYFVDNFRYISSTLKKLGAIKAKRETYFMQANFPA